MLSERPANTLEINNNGEGGGLGNTKKCGYKCLAKIYIYHSGMHIAQTELADTISYNDTDTECLQITFFPPKAYNGDPVIPLLGFTVFTASTSNP